MKTRLALGAALFIAVLITAAAAAPGDVEQIQQAIAREGARWTAAQTPYTDLTPEQKRAMLGLLPDFGDDYPDLPGFPAVPDAVDEEVDWRNRNGANWVTPIRDQGGCGSCWAFGGVAAMESHILIAGNDPTYPLNLSEQYLVSCSPGSCNGWGAHSTLAWLQSDGTVDEPCLPYTASDLTQCNERCNDWVYRNLKITSWGQCYSVAEMKAALAVGPITGAFLVYDDFFAYSGGVYQHVWGGEAGGHMIAIVGYSDAENAWICKNSWGPNWGEDGYFKIRMGYDECGMETWAPLWMTPGPAEFPNLSVDGTTVEEEVGDGDGVLNPGETAALYITLRNIPLGATATGIAGTLESSDPRVTILDDEALFPDLSASAAAANVDPFLVAVTPDAALGTVTLTLNLYANENDPLPYAVSRSVSISLSLYQAGYPIAGTEMDAPPAVCDLEGDGDLDVITVDFGGHVCARDGVGNMLPGFPYTTTGMIKSAPAVADLDNDGDNEIVVTAWAGKLIVLNADGSEAFSPLTLPLFVSANPALGDLDGDGDLEIVVPCWDGQLYIWHHDGTAMAGFPFVVQTGVPLQDGALLLDLSGDGLPEIIFGAYNLKLYAVDGLGQEVWQYTLGGLPGGSPAAADLGEAAPTIVATDQSGKVHLVDAAGQPVRLVNLNQSLKCSPSFADFDGDGELEIAVSGHTGSVHMLNADGTEIPGFPVNLNSYLWVSPSFSDLDGNGCLDLILGDNSGNLHVLTRSGGVLAGFPMALTAGTRSTAAVTNLDADGDLEITMGTFVGLDVLDYKPSGGSNDCWNTFRGNLRRTGYHGDGFLAVAVRPEAPVTPPRNFALHAAHPNPFNPTTVTKFDIREAGHASLRVYDTAGRLVTTLVNGWRDAGSHKAIFDGKGLASGVYLLRLEAGGFSATQKLVLMK